METPEKVSPLKLWFLFNSINQLLYNASGFNCGLQLSSTECEKRPHNCVCFSYSERSIDMHYL